MTDGIRETIGCDLGDRSSELCVVTADGQGKNRPKPLKTSRAAFREFFEGRPKAHVVIEVGTHSRWVCEELTRLGHKVTVANPRRVQLISANERKTDKNDAELLARLGRADVDLLSPVTHRGTQAQADLAVAKARDLLVLTRTRLVLSIRGVVKSFGERLESCDAEGFHRRTRSMVPETLKPALEPLYETLETVEKQLKTYEKELEQVATRYPEVQVVQQPNGVGLLTALVFMLTLEDKKRFEKSRMVGPYLGMVPRLDQSGMSDKQLRITKAGDPFARRLLVNAANYILGPFGKDSDLRRWGLRMAASGGKNGRKRATVAVARKLAVLMHRLWVTGEVYEPLRNSQKREQQPAA